jgi:PAS domain S-box-containing protein
LSDSNTRSLPHGDIMVVEDNVFDLKFLSETLKNAGYRVRPASDGELALRSLQAKLPDLILIDINLPGIKGIDLCRRLKADPETKDLPVIFISALGKIDLKVKALEAGAVDYVTKPIEPSELLARISTHLKIHLLQHQLATQAKELISEIEERIRASEALQESEVKYRALFETSQDAIFVADGETGMVLDANEAGQRILGRPLEEIQGMHHSDVVSPEEKDIGKERFKKVLEEKRIGPQRYDMVSSDGHRTPVEAKSNVIELKDRKLAVAFFRDITEQLQAEDALRIRNNAISSSLNGIAILDLEGSVTYANESVLRMWGYDETEVFGKPFADFWLREKEAVKAMKTLANTENWTGELAAKRKDGSRFDVQLLARLVTDDTGKNVCVVSSFIDVTKEKALQSELIRSERLAASGELAASIAHEINSPLQGIASVISSIERTHKQDEGLAENLNLIKAAFLRIRNIVKRLLDLNRPGKEKEQPMNVNDIIEGTVSLLKSLLKNERVKLSSSLSSKVPMVIASPQQMSQLFLNLINNSVEAMADVSKGKEIMIESNLRGKDIVIKVADTGPGIPKEAMENIFYPFYSSKKRMGVGIGLSICYGIMKDHRGSIAARNSPDGGAVFTITLPAG